MNPETHEPPRTSQTSAGASNRAGNAAKMVAFLAIVLLGQVGLGVDRTIPAPTPKPVVVSCKAAADPAIESATDEKTDTLAGVDNFVIHVSILNRGARGQTAKTRQVVSVYRNEERLEQAPIPPLDAGEAYAFTVHFRRSADAGPGSTTLLFRLGGISYAPNTVADCNDKDNSFRLTF